MPAWLVGLRRPVRTASSSSPGMPSPDISGKEQTFSFLAQQTEILVLVLTGICTVLECDQPPLRLQSGKAPGRVSNPGRAV